MGFLDRDGTRQQRGTVSEPRLRAGLSPTKPIDEEVRGKQISEITTILDSLPQDFFSRYLALVSKHTGFGRKISLYVDYGVDENLTERLNRVGAVPREELLTKSLIDGDPPPITGRDFLFWEGRMVAINTRFSGFPPLILDEPRYWSLRSYSKASLMPERAESGIAGIGVQFSQSTNIGGPETIDTRKFSRREDGNCTLFTTKANYDRLYLDLTGPNVAVITSASERILRTTLKSQRLEITDFSVLDDALEDAFRSPIPVEERKRFIRSDRSMEVKWPRSSGEPHVGSGG